MMHEKRFKLSLQDIRPLALGHGGCIATDHIVVDGMRIGFMYREAPDNEADSGWRFLSGIESDEYMSNPDNFGIYDLNTLANYDPAIILFLDSPEGVAFEREEATGMFKQVAFEPPE